MIVVFASILLPNQVYAELEPVMVKDINLGEVSSDFYDLEALGDTLFISVFEDIHGYELWKSDGTELGTVLVKDINPGENHSNPYSFIVLENVLYFAADDGVHWLEFWKSDGTQEGTVMVKDINPGALRSLGYSEGMFKPFGNKIYFAPKVFE